MFRTDARVDAAKASADLNVEEPKCFKARPASVLQKPPFEPTIEQKVLVEPKAFVMQTDIRAEQRKAFDAMKEEREKARNAAAIAQAELDEAARREAEAIEYKAHAFKAQPVRAHFDKPTFQVHLETSELTVATSPMLRTQERAKLRESNSSIDAHDSQSTSIHPPQKHIDSCEQKSLPNPAEQPTDVESFENFF